MRKTSSLNLFQIASAYIGTVIGAGFASGQEILQFFTAYGVWGIIGIVLSSFLFFFVGYSILMLGRKLKAASHVDIVRHTNGVLLGTFIDIIITLFMFGGLSAMIAGAGAIFKEQFSIPSVWGTLVMALLALLTVITGTRGVINAISFVAPFLILSVLFISVCTLLRNPVTGAEIQASSQLSGATPHWLVSAISYASYNIVISIGVLTPMGAETADKKKLFWGALLGATGLGLCMISIYFCLLTNISEVSAMEVPMIEIAGRISLVIKILFAFVLFAEVYTTAIGNLYGFVRRVTFRFPEKLVVLAATFLAFLVSQLGFSNMVKYLYPAVGYGGVVFFAGVVRVWISKRETIR